MHSFFAYQPIRLPYYSAKSINFQESGRISICVQLKFQAEAADKDAWKNAKSIYEFEALDIDGNSVSLEKYRYAYECSITVKLCF